MSRSMSRSMLIQRKKMSDVRSHDQGCCLFSGMNIHVNNFSGVKPGSVGWRILMGMKPAPNFIILPIRMALDCYTKQTTSQGGVLSKNSILYHIFSQTHINPVIAQIAH